MKIARVETPKPPSPQGPNWGAWLVAVAVAIIVLSSLLLAYRIIQIYAYR